MPLVIMPLRSNFLGLQTHFLLNWWVSDYPGTTTEVVLAGRTQTLDK